MGKLRPQLHDELVVLELGLEAGLPGPAIFFAARLARLCLKVSHTIPRRANSWLHHPHHHNSPIGQSPAPVLEAAPAAKDCTAHPTT